MKDMSPEQGSEMSARAIDVHAHFSTREGSLSMMKYAQGLMSYYLKQEATAEQVLSMCKSDEDMAKDFINAGVKGIIVGWDAETNTGEPGMSNDYVASMVKRFPDAFIGAFGCVDPWKGERAVAEAERCVKELGLLGMKFQGAAQAFYPNDRRFYPIWEKCTELGCPVQIHTGTTGLGAGLPGGMGIKLKWTRPIPYIDDVAADFPELKIICLHPSWPWQEETIAMAIHKSNIFMDLSGWAPKYFPESLKREIRSRLKNRVMFGSDYPMMTFDQLFKGWEDEDYPAEIMKKIYYQNAIRILNLNISEDKFE
jgi:predicted TIM-barrel fold metal-dependent hydrolase